MCSSTPTVERTFKPDLTAPGLARSFYRDNACTDHDCDQDIVLLLLTEAVTNAVRHGDPPLRVSCECRDASVHLVVYDGGTSIPASDQVLTDTAQADQLAEGGRGLALIDALAGSWGFHAEPTGKSFAFDVGC